MADQLLTAAMVHVFALAGFLAGIATLWAISRACRAARTGLRWCWRQITQHDSTTTGDLP
ncbi:hypothetical protein [Stenotrophomonas maltophilia]|uniref:hypothetical protein n=1 Tax=Stenotrophomonas maltophilia TaxID=40324 RepID=UPI000F514E9C|nr:hypothetical protein [Stenotrophomonas maltophilia]AYZ71316.1 hypothetical protein EGY09_15395 [Stenotrophomonas maltophilia]